MMSMQRCIFSAEEPLETSSPPSTRCSEDTQHSSRENFLWEPVLSVEEFEGGTCVTSAITSLFGSSDYSALTPSPATQRIEAATPEEPKEPP